MREVTADRRLSAAIFCASDTNFCISEVFSTADDGDGGLRDGMAELNDDVRRGGLGGLQLLDTAAVGPPAGVDGTARWSSDSVQCCGQPNGLNVDNARSLTSQPWLTGARETSPLRVLSDEKFLSVAESSLLVARLHTATARNKIM